MTVLRVLRTGYTIMALSPTPGAWNEGFSRIKGLVLMSTYAYPVYQEGQCAHGVPCHWGSGAEIISRQCPF